MLLCEAVRVPEVIISNKIENIRGRWFHTDRPFNYKDAITMSTFNAVRSKFQLEKFLKRLHFDGWHSYDSYEYYKQLKLNRFTQLEELKINSNIPRSVNLTLEGNAIRLPNLKILDIVDYDFSRYADDYDQKIVLATPQLKALKSDSLKYISLAHPDTITYLELDFYHSAAAIAPSFTNVQYLKIVREVPQSHTILSDYLRLRTFVCNQLWGAVSPTRRLPLIRGIFDQKRIFKRPELRIYYHSVELVDATKIDEFESAKSILRFQMQNYDNDTLCDNICFDTDDAFDYTELMELVNGRSLSNDFFVKFRNIRAVKVSGVVEQEHLLQFLNRLENLTALQLIDADLDQSFFDALPEECSQLAQLHMRNSTIASYDFLFKLKLLERFSIEHNSSEFFDFSLRLFKELKYFWEFCIVRDDENIRMARGLNEYYFSRSVDSDITRIKKPSDFEHLVRLVNEHKNGTLGWLIDNSESDDA